jgi:hypothetical protein
MYRMLQVIFAGSGINPSVLRHNEIRSAKAGEAELEKVKSTCIKNNRFCREVLLVEAGGEQPRKAKIPWFSVWLAGK